MRTSMRTDIRDIRQAIEESLAVGQRLAWSTVQRLGAQAVDQAVHRLGLGRRGVRLTGDSLTADRGEWRAELSSWSSSAVSEAAELVVYRALLSVFDIGVVAPGGAVGRQSAAEAAWISGLVVRWLRPPYARSATGGGGHVVLYWLADEREAYRRDVLSKLTDGAKATVAVTGFDREGARVVEIEIEVHAVARAQLNRS